MRTVEAYRTESGEVYPADKWHALARIVEAVSEARERCEMTSAELRALAKVSRLVCRLTPPLATDADPFS